MNISAYLYRFLPHQCSLCGDRSANGPICDHCQVDLPHNIHGCRTCALPLTAGQLVCGDCLALPKPYQLTFCPLLYQHPVDHLILRLKKHNPRTGANALLPLLRQSVENHYGSTAPWPDLLVPVPSHRWTRLRRGFNQAHSLAEQLGAAYQLPVHALVRHNGGAKPQKTLDRKTRFANLRNVFDCPTSLQGETVAVVDDVITTGATAILISRCLLRAGAGRVHIWALARTPKPGH